MNFLAAQSHNTVLLPEMIRLLLKDLALRVDPDNDGTFITRELSEISSAFREFAHELTEKFPECKLYFTSGDGFSFQLSDAFDILRFSGALFPCKDTLVIARFPDTKQALEEAAHGLFEDRGQLTEWSEHLKALIVPSPINGSMPKNFSA